MQRFRVVEVLVTCVGVAVGSITANAVDNAWGVDRGRLDVTASDMSNTSAQSRLEAVVTGGVALNPAETLPNAEHHSSAGTGFAGPTDVTISVTVPVIFTATVISQDESSGCHQVIAVTDNRTGDLGWTLRASGGGQGNLSVDQVPGNELDASAASVDQDKVTLPSGIEIGSIRVVADYQTCPNWSLG